MITGIARSLLMRRADTIENNGLHTEELQNKILLRLLSTGRDTLWGREHQLGNVHDYESFRREISLADYSSFKPYVDRMLAGERDILCPGLVRKFALTSGTCGHASKTVPVSETALKECHTRGSVDSAVLYLRDKPSSRILEGKVLTLSGNYEQGQQFPGSKIGMISAILYDDINPVSALFRFPGREVATDPDFGRKITSIANAASKVNVTSMAGIPAWILEMIKKVLEVNWKDNLSEIWPSLEVYAHGGTSFQPYRTMFEKLAGRDVNFMEIYNASEGYYAIQDDLSDPSMLLMTDYGIFYEFRPLDGEGAVPLWGIETGVDYEMFITTSSGLWRYSTGDVVRFTSRDPYKLLVVGRTSEFISMAAEKVDAYDIRKAMDRACREFNVHALEYIIAPCYASMSAKGHYQCLIEFDEAPHDIDAFILCLETKLTEIHTDYGETRGQLGALDRLEIICARKDLFNDWFESLGKLGGQTKLPRVTNNRDMIDKLLKLQ